MGIQDQPDYKRLYEAERAARLEVERRYADFRWETDEYSKRLIHKMQMALAHVRHLLLPRSPREGLPRTQVRGFLFEAPLASYFRARTKFRAAESPMLDNTILLRLHPIQLHHPPALALGTANIACSSFSVAVMQRDYPY
jgi:hypothetical protein